MESAAGLGHIGVMKRMLLLPLVFVFFSCSSRSVRVWFIDSPDGQTVSLPLTLKFGVEGIDLVKAGERPNDLTAGHHHIIIDGDAIAYGTIITADKPKWLHYGKAQTEATLTEKELSKGKHKLTLQYGDWEHKSYGPSLSQTITVTVK